MLCYEQPMPSGATRDAGAETAETLEGVLERFVFVSDDEEFGVALVRPDDGELSDKLSETSEERRASGRSAGRRSSFGSKGDRRC